MRPEEVERIDREFAEVLEQLIQRRQEERAAELLQAAARRMLAERSGLPWPTN